MTDPDPCPPDVGTDERSDQSWAEARFDPGVRPSDEVTIDENAPEAANIGHPE